MLPQEHTGSSLRAKGTPGFWGSCRGGGGLSSAPRMAHPLSEGNQASAEAQSRKCGEQGLGVSLWEMPNEQFRAQEHRVAPGSPRQELGREGVYQGQAGKERAGKSESQEGLERLGSWFL